MGPKKVAFITGANRGLGLETTKQLAEQGVTVLLGARDLASGNVEAQKLKAKNLDVVAVKFDVNSPADHAAVAQYIEKNYGHLDILINNAGIWADEVGMDGRANASFVSQDNLRKTYDANFFNVVAVTQALLPLIRKSAAGRIVNLSSILGSLTLHSTKGSPIDGVRAFAYNSSKTALNAFTIHLAKELQDTAIKVNSAHPGWVKTELGGDAAPMEITDGAKTSVQLALLNQDGPTGGFFHMGDSLPW